jgi:formylglycine-generating enzyme required for sulfatase activity
MSQALAFNIFKIKAKDSTIKDFWTREIDSIFFNIEKDSIFIKGIRINAASAVSDIDSMYFDSADYIARAMSADTFISGKTYVTWIENVEYSNTFVKLDSFIIDATEVTQAAYEKLLGVQPWRRASAHNIGDSLPATHMTWYDAAMYCNARSIAEGLTPVYYFRSYDAENYEEVPVVGISGDSCIVNIEIRTISAYNGWRLPTSSEYEYAARGGIFHNNLRDTSADYIWGNGKVWDSTNTSEWLPYTHSLTKNSDTAYEVASLLPNDSGIYDMHGNVHEWAQNYDPIREVSSYTMPIINPGINITYNADGTPFNFVRYSAGVGEMWRAAVDCKEGHALASYKGFRCVRRAQR